MSGAVAYSGRRVSSGAHVEGSPTPGRGWLPSTGVTRCFALWPTYPTLADMEGARRYSREDIPLLRELRAQVRIPRAYLARRLVERSQFRKAGGQSSRTRRRVVLNSRFEEERRVQRQPQVGSRSLHVLGDAVARLARTQRSAGWYANPRRGSKPFLYAL